jgi:hypothetical protein
LYDVSGADATDFAVVQAHQDAVLASHEHAALPNDDCAGSKAEDPYENVFVRVGMFREYHEASILARASAKRPE